MANFSKNKKEKMFIVAGIFLFLIMAGIFAYSIKFLAPLIEKTLGNNSVKNLEPAKINLKGLKELGIVK
ncbi:hypothetical protein HY227_02715 [Candidatus Wolfebacteria bacterium]|nr:hypothetical protein [Candidatus Wolfebacteria bacterium]